MQKKLIALAVAGLISGGAYAQASNVTIYGIIDQMVDNTKLTGNTAGVSQTATSRGGVDAGFLSGSRLGFKGEEALGNGLSAIFLLENGLSVDVPGTAGSWAALSRQSYVGLSSNSWGSIRIGRNYAAGYYSPGAYDGLASATISPQSVLSVQSGMTITPNSGARVSNSINYVSPNWSGFSVNAIYGFGEARTGLVAPTDQDSKAGNFAGIGVTYANGPISANVTYQESYSVPAAASPATSPLKNKEWFIGGAYDFQVVKIGASWQNQKGSQTAAGAGDGTDKLWQVSAVAPVGGNGSLAFSYGKLTDGVDGVAPVTTDGKSWALLYNYNLSKRTTAYAGYNHTKYDNASIAGGAVANNTANANATFEVFGVGMRHVF